MGPNPPPKLLHLFKGPRDCGAVRGAERGRILHLSSLLLLLFQKVVWNQLTKVIGSDYSVRCAGMTGLESRQRYWLHPWHSAAALRLLACVCVCAETSQTGLRRACARCVSLHFVALRAGYTLRGWNCVCVSTWVSAILVAGGSSGQGYFGQSRCRMVGWSGEGNEPADASGVVLVTGGDE